MRRRTFLAATGSTASTITIAGCTEGSEGGDGTDGSDGGGGAGDGGTADPTGTPTAEPDGEADGLNVAMVTDGNEYYFEPIGLHVELGETVTFVNESGSHSSTAYHERVDAAGTTRIPDGAEPWDSGTLSGESETFEHTFDTAGSYDYFCVPHRSMEMVGRIVVGDPGGPAEGSMPSDGEVPDSDTIVDRGTVPHDQVHD